MSLLWFKPSKLGLKRALSYGGPGGCKFPEKNILQLIGCHNVLANVKGVILETTALLVNSLKRKCEHVIHQ